MANLIAKKKNNSLLLTILLANRPLNEKILQNRITNCLRANDCFVEPIENSVTSGMPDILAIKEGKVLFVEVKNKAKPVNYLSTSQIEKMRAMLTAGAAVYVAGVIRRQRNYYVNFVKVNKTMLRKIKRQ